MADTDPTLTCTTTAVGMPRTASDDDVEMAERVFPDANNQSMISTTPSFSNAQEMMIATLHDALKGPQDMMKALAELQKSGFEFNKETTLAINKRIEMLMGTRPPTMDEVPEAMVKMLEASVKAQKELLEDSVKAQREIWKLKQTQMVNYSKGVRAAASAADGASRATTGLIEDSVQRHVTPLRRSIAQLSKALTSRDSTKRKRAPTPPKLEMDASDDDEEEEEIVTSTTGLII